MSGDVVQPALADIIRRFREHPGLRAKASIGLVAEALGPTDWLTGPGDDAAVVAEGLDGSALAAGEAIWPPFIEDDPHGAGMAAVVAILGGVWLHRSPRHVHAWRRDASHPPAAARS